jgi:hypothetical protein
MFIVSEFSKHALAPSGAKCKDWNIPLLTELEKSGAASAINISLLEGATTTFQMNPAFLIAVCACIDTIEVNKHRSETAVCSINAIANCYRSN